MYRREESVYGVWFRGPERFHLRVILNHRLTKPGYPIHSFFYFDVCNYIYVIDNLSVMTFF